MHSWAEGPLIGFDIESTSPDPAVARIVSASVVICEQHREPVVSEWLVAVDEDIPAEATAVHGVTTEMARRDGRPLLDVLIEIREALRQTWDDDLPVIIYNAPYDLRVLNRESERCVMEPFGFTVDATSILDPLVIDRGVDRFRKGKRTLTATCGHYRVPLTAAHSSSADAVAAVGVMREIADRFPEIARSPLPGLYRRQQEWFSSWAANFEEYLRSRKASEGATPEEIEAVVIDRSWPVRTSGEPL